ncbi:MAG: hypothetical protein RLZZ153_1615 [Pseudomonadota bacterium]
MSPLNIAIVGSGISGCAAAWQLSRWANVTVFESADRLGGHTHTQTIQVDDTEVSVDTGFIVFNHRTYPGLRAWFDLLGVETAKSDMSFSASLNDGALEWCGTDLNSVFAQRKNLLSPRFWGMLADIVRFNRQAPRDAARYRTLSGNGPSLGDYLDQERYGKLFLDAYLLPMAGAIWSCPTEQMRAFPLTTFVQFCENHGLLQIADRPQWYTVRNGSKNYLAKMQQALAREGRQVQWRTGFAVKEVQPGVRPDGRQQVTLAGLAHDSDEPQLFSETFDAVVLACHSDQAAAMLPKRSPARSIVTDIHYQHNRAILHTDLRLMPKRQSAWASWNYMHQNQTGLTNPVSVTYWMNRLQPLPVSTPILVSLNPLCEPDPSKVFNTMDYEHPIFDARAVLAQKRLPAVQGQDGIWLAGAWTRYGFHEDGFQSGVQAAELMQSALQRAGHGESLAKAA